MKKALLAAVAILGFVILTPGTTFAHHTNVTGSTTCLAADGTSTVTWSVIHPAEDWSAGPATVTSNRRSAPFSGLLARGATATTSEVVLWNVPSVSLSIFSRWENGNSSTDSATVLRPAPCPVVTTTTVTPTTTTVPPTTTVIETTTTIAETTTTVAETTTTLAETTVPTTTSPTVVATSVVPTTVTPTSVDVPAVTELPSTGFVSTLFWVAVILLLVGALLRILRRN